MISQCLAMSKLFRTLLAFVNFSNSLMFGFDMVLQGSCIFETFRTLLAFVFLDLQVYVVDVSLECSCLPESFVTGVTFMISHFVMDLEND